MIMKKLATLALIGAALAVPAFAETAQEYHNNVKSDAAAIQKDDAALANQTNTLEENRAKKAMHKANGDVAGQAVDSVKIGANHVGIAAKKTEKNIDKDIKKYDEGKPDPGPTPPSPSN
jgi:ribonuclease I